MEICELSDLPVNQCEHCRETGAYVPVKPGLNSRLKKSKVNKKGVDDDED